MRSPVIHRTTLHSGGATSPTVELYQRANGHCRLWAYWFDQDGQQSETIASFHEPNWAKARAKATETLKTALAGELSVREAPSTKPSRITGSPRYAC